MKKPVKTIISFILSVMLAMSVSVPALASPAVIEGTELTYTLDGGVLTIQGRGEMPYWSETEKSPFADNLQIEKIIIKDGVISVGAYAFSGCASLKEVNLPSGLIYIESYAFSGCTALENLEIPENTSYISPFFIRNSKISLTVNKNNKYFSAKEGMLYSKDGKALCALSDISVKGELNVPDGTEKISDRAFAFFPAGIKINIPASVTEISPGAFMYSEPEIVFAPGSNFIVSGNNMIFTKDGKELVALLLAEDPVEFSVPEGTERLGDFLFTYRGKLETVNLPSSLKNIGKNAFAYCKNLKAVNIPEGARAEEGAFLFCGSLQEITLPDSFEEVPFEMFAKCEALKKVNFGKNIKKIGTRAFDCCALEELKLPASLKEIGKYAFNKALTDKVKEISFPASLEKIDEDAFVECAYLEKVNMPESLLFIGERAFSLCSLLTEVNNIPEKTEYIGADAFYDTPFINNLKKTSEEVYLGRVLIAGSRKAEVLKVKDGTTMIADMACYGCMNLKEAELPDSLLFIDNYAFAHTGLESINVPGSLVFAGEKIFDRTPYMRDFKNGPVYFGNVLIGYKGKTPESGEIEIREGTVSVASGVFYNNRTFSDVDYSNVKYISLPQSLRFAGAFAFYSLDNVEALKLPSGLEILGMYALPSGIKKIYIPGKNTVIRSFDNPELVVCKAGSYAEAFAKRIELEYSLCECTDLQKVPEKAPSYTEEGLKAHWRCRNCGEIFADRMKTPTTYEELRIEKSNEGRCGADIRYTVSDGVLTFTGSGKMNEDCSDFIYNTEIKKLVVSEGIEGICEGAFTGCKNLEYAVLPESLEKIPNYLFYGCSSLKEIKIPDKIKVIGVGAFEGCTSLSSVTLPSSLTTIYDNAFLECEALSEIKIPGKTEYIGPLAFALCSVKEVILPASVSEFFTSSFMSDEKTKVTVLNNKCLLEDDAKNPELLIIEAYPESSLKAFAGENGYTFEAIPPGHRFEYIAEVPPTCTENGVKAYYKCLFCGLSFEDKEGKIPLTDTVLKAKGHIFGEWETVTAPTCTEDGTEKRVCSVCNAEETRAVKAKGHDFGEWETIKKPGFTETGLMRRYCKNDKSHYEEKIIEKLKAMPGDVNGNGELTASDARLALRIAVKLEKEVTEQMLLSADADGDGQVLSSDARIILRAAVGLGKI